MKWLDTISKLYVVTQLSMIDFLTISCSGEQFFTSSITMALAFPSAWSPLASIPYSKTNSVVVCLCWFWKGIQIDLWNYLLLKTLTSTVHDGKPPSCQSCNASQRKFVHPKGEIIYGSLSPWSSPCIEETISWQSKTCEQPISESTIQPCSEWEVTSTLPS